MLDDLPVLHDIKAIGEWRGKTKILFDHHDGVATRLQHHDHSRERLDDDRRKPF